MRRCLVIFVALSATAAALARKPGEPSPEPPPPAPVSLEVVGQREVVLDTGGRTAAQFRADIAAGRLTPQPLACGLKLRITNNTRVPIRIRASSRANERQLALEGKAVSREFTGTAAQPPTAYVVLKPRQSHTIPLGQLAGYRTRVLAYQVPLEAGEYTLKASLSVWITGYDGAVRIGRGARVPPVPGMKSGHNVLVAPPFKLTVKAK